MSSIPALEVALLAWACSAVALSWPAALLALNSVYGYWIRVTWSNLLKTKQVTSSYPKTIKYRSSSKAHIPWAMSLIPNTKILSQDRVPPAMEKFNDPIFQNKRLEASWRELV